jgi:hypothetical protein
MIETTLQTSSRPLRSPSASGRPPDADTTRLMQAVLHAGVELATAARETGDPAVADFTLRAARRLYGTAALVLEHYESGDGETRQLRSDVERLQALLDSPA